MKSILIIAFSELHKDPRIQRQISFLKERYRISAAGFSSPGIEEVEFIPIPNTRRSSLTRTKRALLLKLRAFHRYYWQPEMNNLAGLLGSRSNDLILANDIDTLPLAFRIRGESKILFDAHEYAPLEFEDVFIWRFFYKKYRTYFCRKYLPHVDRMTTVSKGIRSEYKKRFGVEAELITNASPYINLKPHPINGNEIRVIHHGAAIRSRKIEGMIEAASQLDSRYSFSFMLTPNDPEYLNQLKKKAAGETNIHFPEPQPFHAIIPFLNRFDIGLFSLPPTNFNYRHALPNKLFEFIQARLAVVIGPTPDMAEIVSEYECGCVTPDFSVQSLVSTLSNLDIKEIERYQSHSHDAAAKLCAEKNGERLLAMVRELIGES